MGTFAKYFWAALFLVALSLGFSGRVNAARATSKGTIELIYKPEADGRWHLWLFSSDRQLVCEDMLAMKLREPSQPAVEPLEIVCDQPKGGQ
jgi:hypothetical protein